DGPARGERHEGGPVLAREHDARARLLALEDAREEVGAEFGDRGERRCRAWRDEGVGVDLAVRMPERHPDRLAAVLEGENLGDAGQRRELARAMRPGLDDGTDAAHALGAERAGRLGAEAHDLAATDGG